MEWNRVFLIGWLGVYILTLIGNHATKCTDALLYDTTLILLTFLGIIIFLVAYDNV